MIIDYETWKRFYEGKYKIIRRETNFQKYQVFSARKIFEVTEECFHKIELFKPDEDVSNLKEFVQESPYWSIYRSGDKLWKSYYQFRYDQVWFENVIMPNVEVVDSSHEKIKIYLADDVATNYWSIYYVREYDRDKISGPQVWKQYYKTEEEQIKAATQAYPDLYIIAHSYNLERCRMEAASDKMKKSKCCGTALKK